MKKTRNTNRIASALLAALLIVLASTAFANNSTGKEKGSDSKESLEKYIEPLESDIILEMVSFEAPATIVIMDENNNIICQAESSEDNLEPKVSILLRRADYLMENENTQYYRVYLN